MMNFKKELVSFAAVSAFCLTVLTGNLAAQQFDQEALDQAMPALPEVSDAQSKGSQNRSSNPRMKCFVDTPAFDLFTFSVCISSGTAFTTSAVFQIDSPPSNFTILWSDSRCNSNLTTCVLPIRQYQQVTLSATVLDNSNNTFTNTSATAFYEGFL